MRGCPNRPQGKIRVKICHSDQRLGPASLQIRGLLGEFGLVIPKAISHVAKRVAEILDGASNELPVAFRQLIDHLTRQLHKKELFGASESVFVG
jgi:hypothetical protein